MSLEFRAPSSASARLAPSLRLNLFGFERDLSKRRIGADRRLADWGLRGPHYRLLSRYRRADRLAWCLARAPGRTAGAGTERYRQCRHLRQQQRCRLFAGATHRRLRRADRHAEGSAQSARHSTSRSRHDLLDHQQDPAFARRFRPRHRARSDQCEGVSRALQRLPQHRPARPGAGRRQPGGAARSQRCQSVRLSRQCLQQ
jgi:hypothetical protein